VITLNKKSGSLNIELLAFLLLVISLQGLSQVPFPYKNPVLPVEYRVNDLLQRMTAEEKFMQLFMIPGDLGIGKEPLKNGIFGLQIGASGLNNDAAGQLLNYQSSGLAVDFANKVNATQQFFLDETRLGIPIIAFDEGLHGLIRDGATAFPQSIGLAATFDPELMKEVASAIASESRARGIRQLLSPVLNIARDVRWGRTEETYGEDPFLVMQMGNAYIAALEQTGVVATPKHFAVNVGDGGRDSYPIQVNERQMEENYFPAFKSAIQTAGARSLMTAYNSFDGMPCSANHWLLQKKVKEDWGFNGFIISDACAVGGANVLHMTATDYSEAGRQAIENGLDVIFQTNINHAELFSAPFLDGTLRKEAIDSAVMRVLRAKFELGLFENPFVTPAETKAYNNLERHREIALKAARESIVLLKNEESVLPLSSSIKNIAVIGSDAVDARLGGYSGPGNNKVSILQGIQQTAPNGDKVSFVEGCGRSRVEYVPVPAENLCVYGNGNKSPGLMAEYFTNIALQGKPKISRIDPNINFSWTLYGPDPAISPDWYSVRWTGKIIGISSGTCKIGVEGSDGYRLYLDGRLLIDNWQKRSSGVILKEVNMQKGKEHDVRLEFYETTGNAKIKLVWNSGIQDTLSESIKKAVKLVSEAELAVVVAGIEEGEFRDRSSLKLPGRQEELIRAVAATGKPVVVVLVGGSAITMNNWLDQVQAVLEVWYPGEAGGTAVAEILFGKYCPGGRLPITFPLSEGQLPLVYNHKPTGRGDDYEDLTGQPLFPFGFGLSYTTFSYTNLTFNKLSFSTKDTVILKFSVKNTGKFAGDEVCQVYIHDELSSLAQPVMTLKSFKRIHLQPGETKVISLPMPPDSFTIFDKQMKKIIEPGAFSIMVGSSSKEIKLRGTLSFYP